MKGITQSPDWNLPEWEQVLTDTVPRFCRKFSLHPPPGMEWDDFLQEMRKILIVRSQSPGSQWDPNRSSWTHWVLIILRTYNINLWKQSRAKMRIPRDLIDFEASELHDLEGGLLPPLKDIPLEHIMESK